MTKDDQLVVLHDHYLDRVTDVAERFPNRARKDGRYYAIDFTLAEIRSLKFTEGFEIENARRCRSIRGVSRWASLTSVFTPSKRRSSLFRAEPLDGQKYRYLPGNQSAVVPPSGRKRHCREDAGGTEKVRLHQQAG